MILYKVDNLVGIVIYNWSHFLLFSLQKNRPSAAAQAKKKKKEKDEATTFLVRVG